VVIIDEAMTRASMSLSEVLQPMPGRNVAARKQEILLSI
jgi:hypothetical protein